MFLTVGLRCLCWYNLFWFSSNAIPCIMAKHLQFGFLCPENIAPDVLQFFQIQLYKWMSLFATLPCHPLFFRENKLSPGNEPQLFGFSLIALSWFKCWLDPVWSQMYFCCAIYLTILSDLGVTGRVMDSIYLSFWKLTHNSSKIDGQQQQLLLWNNFWCLSRLANLS